MSKNMRIYASLNGERIKVPTENKNYDEKAIRAVCLEKSVNPDCSDCPGEVIAKCGEINAHHWACVNTTCNHIYEPMTAWHVNWQDRGHQNGYDDEHYFPNDGTHIKSHKADLFNGKEVIEFQHSPISSSELLERNIFYQKNAEKVSWVFDWTGKDLYDKEDKYYLKHEEIHHDKSLDGFFHTTTVDGKALKSYIIYKSLNTLKNLFEFGIPKYGSVYLDLGYKVLDVIEFSGNKTIQCIELNPNEIFNHENDTIAWINRKISESESLKSRLNELCAIKMPAYIESDEFKNKLNEKVISLSNVTLDKMVIELANARADELSKTDEFKNLIDSKISPLYAARIEAELAQQIRYMQNGTGFRDMVNAQLTEYIKSDKHKSEINKKAEELYTEYKTSEKFNYDINILVDKFKYNAAQSVYYNIHGISLVKMKNYVKALKSFNKSIDFDKDNTDAQNNIKKLLAMKKKNIVKGITS